MENQNKTINSDEISWLVPEYEKRDRPKGWYYGAGAVFVFFTLYSLFGWKFWQLDFSQFNPLFFFIIIISTYVIILNDKQEPAMVTVILADEGIIVGKKFYDYDELKDFAVVYKPNQELKNLYFEFKSAVKQRLSLPLIDEDPIKVRNYLLRYLEEDLERTDRSASESLAGMFKL